MKFIDIIILIPILYGIYQGYQKGLVTMLFEVISIILGVILAFKLLQVGIGVLYQYFPNMSKILPFLSFLVIFTLVLLGVRAIGFAIKTVLDFTIFAGILDNIAGAFIGLFRWTFTVSILVWLVKSSGIIIPENITKDAPLFQFISSIAPYTISVIEFIFPFAQDLFNLVKKQL
ncbi:MAG: CvpA family protein [Cytophagales bacterium]|nr:MAG: CvpA family protein [Cytophagales bacterium]